jgi:hypothetical protein
MSKEIKYIFASKMLSLDSIDFDRALVYVPKCFKELATKTTYIFKCNLQF